MVVSSWNSAQYPSTGSLKEKPKPWGEIVELTWGSLLKKKQKVWYQWVKGWLSATLKVIWSLIWDSESTPEMCLRSCQENFQPVSAGQSHPRTVFILNELKNKPGKDPAHHGENQTNRDAIHAFMFPFSTLCCWWWRLKQDREGPGNAPIWGVPDCSHPMSLPGMACNEHLWCFLQTDEGSWLRPFLAPSSSFSLRREPHYGSMLPIRQARDLPKKQSRRQSPTQIRGQNPTTHLSCLICLQNLFTRGFSSVLMVGSLSFLSLLGKGMMITESALKLWRGRLHQLFLAWWWNGEDCLKRSLSRAAIFLKQFRFCP